ncbi:MAG: hypothetical protein IJ179_06990 [Oscillospiraceae bacterium]|nr:hypothetical protein [Oscillospiraceae bacterium]
MKRALVLLFIICILPLYGCSSIYANYREVEQLRVMQAMGLDRTPGGVTVTLAAAEDRSGNAPLCFSGTGESISAAIEAARLHSVEEDLFTGHLKHILIGEEAARQSIEPYLSYICRSPDARMDMPLFILRGATAREAMSAAGNGEKGVSEALQAAQSKLDMQLGGHVFTAAEVLQRSARSGCALICALEYDSAAEEEPATAEEGTDTLDTEADATETSASSTEESVSSEEKSDFKTVSAGSYAVIKDGKLREFIGPEAALGVSFLTNTVGVRDLVVRDRFGAPVTLEINSGGTRLRPLWAEDGSLRGIEIYADVSAALLESGSTALSAVESADYLTGQLEAAVSDQIGAVLWIARNLEADFLGLADRLEQAAPLEYRRMDQALGPLLPTLELSIAVRGELRHGHDMD